MTQTSTATKTYPTYQTALVDQIAKAREVMQHLINTNSPSRSRQERLINKLKAKLAATSYAA